MDAKHKKIALGIVAVLGLAAAGFLLLRDTKPKVPDAALQAEQAAVQSYEQAATETQAKRERELGFKEEQQLQEKGPTAPGGGMRAAPK